MEESDNLNLAARAQQGEEAAFAEIFRRFADRLVRLARSRISERLAARIEAEDVVQSVFRTFFAHAREAEFTFNAENDLWKLLVAMTLNKLRNKVDWHTAAKRDVGAEQPLETPTDDRPNAFDLDGETPSPAAVVAFLDLLEHFLSRLRPQERRILELRMQDFTQDEIARQVGCTERTVRRVLERIRQQAEVQGVREDLAD